MLLKVIKTLFKISSYSLHPSLTSMEPQTIVIIEEPIRPTDELTISGGKVSVITAETSIPAIIVQAPPTHNGRGHIVFRPIEARITQKANPNGTIDPYCKFKIGRHSAKSSVNNHKRNYPTWRESIALERRHNEHFAKVSLKDNDRVLPRQIGSVKVPLDGIILANGSVDTWYNLTKKDVIVGEIRLIIEFTPDIPAAKIVAEQTDPSVQVINVI